MSGFVPIETDRLVIRSPVIADVEALHERRNHPEAARYQDWSMPSAIESARRAVVGAAAMSGPTDGEWWMGTVVLANDQERVIGDVGVKLDSQGRAGMIGYTFHPDQWGHGYATEAVAALVDRLIDHGARRLVATIAPENLASVRVVERAGFAYEGRTVGSWFHDDPEADATDDLLFGLTAEARARWLTRPTQRAKQVRLTELDDDRQRRVAGLAVHYSQDHLVAPVLESYANALFPRVIDGEPIRPWLRAIEADDGRGGPVEPVGFVMLAFLGDRDPYLWRLLIDRWHQRRGIASAALDQIEDQLRADGHRAVTVHWVDAPGSAGPLYRSRGYEPTGKVEHGEIEGRKLLA